MEEGTRSSLTSHFPDSTFQILDKKEKSEVSRREESLGRGGYERRNVLFERNS